MALVEALKKITVKDVMKGKPEMQEMQIAVMNDDGSPVVDKDNNPVTRTVKVAKEQDVCMVFGKAHAMEPGSTQYGPFETYVGSFEARRIKDGSIFQSTRIIFPPIASDIAMQAWLSAKQQDETAQVVFAFMVGVSPDPRARDGYKWSCKPISTGADTVNPLDELRSSLALNFAETLGEDLMAKLGLSLPGQDAKLIPHDKTTGEVKDEPETPKGAKK